MSGSKQYTYQTLCGAYVRKSTRIVMFRNNYKWQLGLGFPHVNQIILLVFS